MTFLLSLVVTLIALAVGFAWGYSKKEAEIADAPVPEWVPYWAVHIHEYVAKQMEWSRSVFGEPKYTDSERLVRHIQKELKEIEKDPTDCEEWVDVMILAIDGAWRAGHSPLTIAYTLQMKQDKNIARKWVIPDDPTIPIEHDRSVDTYESRIQKAGYYRDMEERETNP